MDIEAVTKAVSLSFNFLIIFDQNKSPVSPSAPCVTRRLSTFSVTPLGIVRLYVILLKMSCSELKIVSQLGSHETRVHDFVYPKTNFYAGLDGIYLFSSFLTKLVYIELTHFNLFLTNSFKTSPPYLKLKLIKFN